MYYLDAFLHDLMSQVSQMSFYGEPRWMKCNKLLQGRQRDISMSRCNWPIEEKYNLFDCVLFIFYISLFVVFSVWCYCVTITS